MSNAWSNAWDKTVKAVAIIAGFIAGLYGGWSTALTILVIMMGVDFLTGLILGWQCKSDKTDTGGLSSRAGFIGLLKKGVIMLIVLVATMLDKAVGNTAQIFQQATVFYYIANEGLSILENADAIGIKTPKFIHDRLEIMRQQNDDKPPDGPDDNLPAA